MISEIIDEFDGIILIHPEWYLDDICKGEDFFPKVDNYLIDLQKANNAVQKSNSQVFILPNDYSLINQMPPEITASWKILGKDQEFKFYTTPDLPLQEISKQTKTPLSDLRFIYGGMLTSACVSSFAMRSSASYDGPHPFIKPASMELEATQKASYGFVLEELCSDFIFNN